MWIIGKEVKTKVIIDSKEVGHQTAGYMAKHFKSKFRAVWYMKFHAYWDGDEEAPFVDDKEVIISYTLRHE